VNPPDTKTSPEPVRPESQPHGTTADQINEMESEGQGGTPKEAPKPACAPAPHQTTKVSIPRGTVAK
jgi:hypothetical protein